MILTGQLALNPPLQSALDQLATDESVIVLTETTSNLYNPAFIGCIDRVIDGLDETAAAEFRPDILLTFGGAVGTPAAYNDLTSWIEDFELATPGSFNAVFSTSHAPWYAP